jgi:hypothetical protein
LRLRRRRRSLSAFETLDLFFKLLLLSFGSLTSCVGVRCGFCLKLCLVFEPPLLGFCSL